MRPRGIELLAGLKTEERIQCGKKDIKHISPVAQGFWYFGLLDKDKTLELNLR
jgi:hypothetical protein